MNNSADKNSQSSRGDTGILRQNTAKVLKSQKSVNFTAQVEEQQAGIVAGQPPLAQKPSQNGTAAPEPEVVVAPVVKKKKSLNDIIIDGNALGCIGETNRARIALGKFAENPYFDAFVYNLIGLNSLFLALEEPMLSPEDVYSRSTIELMGNVVSSLFIGECVVKVIVMGLGRGKYAYLKDNYNKLDFFIVIFSILSWVLESSDTGIDLNYLKALRALRALRPLKLVSKNEGMKLVVNSILASIPNLINVFLISMLFYFVFGVMGLQMLSGRVNSCSTDIMLDMEPCIAIGGEWLLPANNYNNVF